MINKRGHLCYINPIRFFNADYGIACRKHIVRSYAINLIVDVSQLPIFQNAMTYPCINMYGYLQEDNKIKYCQPVSLQHILYLQDINYSYFPQNLFDKATGYKFIIPKDSMTGKIINKIDRNSRRISEDFSTARGLANNKVDFDGNEYEAIKSKSVQKYYLQERIKISTGFADRFANEMIVLPRTVLALKATLKPKGIVLLDRIYYLVPKQKAELKFTLGVINAKATNFWFEYYYSSAKVSGNYFDLNGNQIESIPIPIATDEQQSAIASLVDVILARKKKNPETDTGALEREIDQLVYSLYGLTSDEIAIIERE